MSDFEGPDFGRQLIAKTIECESQLAAISHLRQALKKTIDALQRFNPHGSHPGECHCQICEGEHALSTTSGWEEK